MKMNKKILIPIIAGAMVVIGVIIFFIIRSKDPSYFNIKIMDKTGTVNIDRDSTSIEVYEDLKIRDKDYLRVGQDGFTRIDCDRSTYSHFEHNTEASFIADNDKKLTIDLVKGEMVVELQKSLSNEEKLNVTTPNTAMAIRGTVVAVKVIHEANGGARTLNYCLEGEAVVESADGSTETIKAGEGRLVVSDKSGNIIESKAAGAEAFEFNGIDINTLKGADEKSMVLKDSDGNPVRSNLPATMSGEDVVIDGNNFPDMMFRMFIIDRIDFNGDGVLSPYELGEVSIDVASSGIKDLKGIEFFKDLLTLRCQSNELTYLDLSRNTKLTNLYCSKNQLESLDIANCTELVYLSCENNKIEKLDLSKCSKLNFVNCSENKLESLDVSKATELDSLNCGNNKILDLDLSSNTELTYLACNSNPLTNIDVSHNTRLLYLYCYSDQLKRLDVSSNTELQCLYMGDNQIMHIDLSKNSELTELSCYNCFLSELDVSQNKKLVILVCNSGSKKFRNLDVTNNTELRQLDISFNNISEIDLSKNTKLEKLSCYYTELTELDLTNNPMITDENLEYDLGKVTVKR